MIGFWGLPASRLRRFGVPLRYGFAVAHTSRPSGVSVLPASRSALRIASPCAPSARVSPLRGFSIILSLIGANTQVRPHKRQNNHSCVT
jgi:hypothetical protein